MSGHQTATIEDTVYFWFAANDTSGSGGDGATPLFDVREAGAAAGAIPLLSGTPTLLTHANYPAGCHEIAVAATAGNGFAADDTFAVFCTIAIDSQNPSGLVGSCTLTPLAKAAALATVQADTDDIQTRIPAALDGGFMTSHVNVILAGAIDAAAIATDAIDADAIATDGANEIADALLNRDMSAVSDTTARSPLNALRFLRNKWSIAGTTLTVTKEDDAASAWTSTVTADAAADPITGNDPA
ncbi:MAG: hypothetical protein ABUK15_07355 [Anaerolineales bacterium]